MWSHREKGKPMDKCPTCGSTATIDDGLACAQCGCDRDANERLALTACSPSSDTPETDVRAKRICGNWNNAGDRVQEFVLADVARKLERERDAARAAAKYAECYMRHHPGCRTQGLVIDATRDRCDCGLVETWREVRNGILPEND
jgi:hypothetical protein